MKLQEALRQIGQHSQAALNRVAPPQSRLDAEVESPADALLKAFLWRASGEGYQFWDSVYRNLVSGTPMPVPDMPVPETTTPVPMPFPEGLPPLPPVPAGYDRWEYRGRAWEAQNVVYAYSHPDSGKWLWDERVLNTGACSGHYAEAVKDVPVLVPVLEPEPEEVPVLVPVLEPVHEPRVHPFRLPDGCPPVPPVPEGFSHWEYRGMGWCSEGDTTYAYWYPHHLYWGCHDSTGTTADDTCHYLEAVRAVAPEPTPEPEWPPVPEGYSHWVDRGIGFHSEGVCVMCALRLISTVDGTTDAWAVWDEEYPATGNRNAHYLEAVKAVLTEPPSTAIPRHLLPLPPLPEGFRQWVYRGTGWSCEYGPEFRFMNMAEGSEWLRDSTRSSAIGCNNLHYIEALRVPLQCQAGRCYVQRDGVIRDGLQVNIGGNPFHCGMYYRTAKGNIFSSGLPQPQDFMAEVTPQ